jgi:hypothetical protein
LAISFFIEIIIVLLILSLSCISKIFEKIVFKNICKHLHKNKLLYKFQSGFIPDLSTTHQLLEIYHTILTALDSKCFTSITFADVSKAFDRAAKSLLSPSMSSAISFMNTTNNRGSWTDLLGIPAFKSSKTNLL